MIKRLLRPGLALAALATCATAPTGKFYAKGPCETASVKSPDDACMAEYKQEWDERTPGAMAIYIISCKAEGGRPNGIGAIAYGEHPEHGIATRWPTNDHVEIALPAGVSPTQPVADEDGHFKSRKGGLPTLVTPVAGGRSIEISYRVLTPKDREWNHSCFKTRRGSKHGEITCAGVIRSKPALGARGILACCKAAF